MKRVLFGCFRTADLGQQYEVVSRVAGNFSYLSTQTFFSVSHSAWYALSLPKSAYPGLFHPLGFSGVWARTLSLFLVLCYAGYYPRCIIVWKLGFWGPYMHFTALGFRCSFVTPSLASVICTVSTVQLALFSTTAISVSLISISPDRKISIIK